MTEFVPSIFWATQPEANSEQSLASWLQPSSDNSSAATSRCRAPPSKRESRQERYGKRKAWANLLNHTSRDPGVESQGRRVEDRLSEWLEPRPPCGGKSRAIDGRAWGGGAAAESPSDEPPEGEEDVCHEDWVSTRLEGLDPTGAAKAKDDWTNRTKRNLSVTDIALGAKRKTQGGRGWRTTPSRGKVFVAPSHGGPALVATGQKAFKMSTSGRKKRAF